METMHTGSGRASHMPPEGPLGQNNEGAPVLASLKPKTLPFVVLAASEPLHQDSWSTRCWKDWNKFIKGGAAPAGLLMRDLLDIWDIARRDAHDEPILDVPGILSGGSR